MAEANLNGILVIDKPANISSAGVVRIVKRKIGADKVGHAGTLDPFAEGVLVCCINQATRLAGFFLSGKKKYAATIKLGEETDTQDFTGTVISKKEPPEFSPHAIHHTFQKFCGSIDQLPPVYSALKHCGVPIYKLARRGTPVQKPPRRVRIDRMDIREIAPPFVRFEVTCSAGTYIRTLCADIGKSLGCGGHLTALKRLESSGFTLAQAVPLCELEGAGDSTELAGHIIKMADALPDMPQVRADRMLAQKIRYGRLISPADLAVADGTGRKMPCGSKIKIVDRQGNLLAILHHDETGDRMEYRCAFPPQDPQEFRA